MLLMASCLCLFNSYLEKKVPSLAPMLSARYMLLMMGFFAVYCGLMYNDMMAIPIWSAWGSCYKIPEKTTPGQELKPQPDCVYAFGVDPVWYVGTNNLTFMNSLKMKLSVILGVAHMSLGILMKAMNAFERRSHIDFWLEFLPQIIFMLVIFGYMDAMIIVKWLTDWTGRESQAPSIISTMIAVVLSGGSIPDKDAAIIGSKSTQ